MVFFVDNWNNLLYTIVRDLREPIDTRYVNVSRITNTGIVPLPYSEKVNNAQNWIFYGKGCGALIYSFNPTELVVTKVTFPISGIKNCTIPNLPFPLHSEPKPTPQEDNFLAVGSIVAGVIIPIVIVMVVVQHYYDIQINYLTVGIGTE